MKKEKKKKRDKRTREEPEKQPREKEGPSEPQKLPEAPLQYAISLVGGKWKLRILWVLRQGEPVRYREIRLQIPGITDMMLSQSLRGLAAAGLVERRQYQEIPPKVEYCITPGGLELMPALELIAAWAEKRQRG